MCQWSKMCTHGVSQYDKNPTKPISLVQSRHYHYHNKTGSHYDIAENMMTWC